VREERSAPDLRGSTLRIIAAGLPNPWTGRPFSSSALSPQQLYHRPEADRTRFFSGGDFGAARPTGGGTGWTRAVGRRYKDVSSQRERGQANRREIRDS
jgi:hypothetical protein